MKNFTPALVGNIKQKKGLKSFFFGRSTANAYYKARHKTEDISIMWIESKRFGKTDCYPCVFDEYGDPMVYHGGTVVGSKKKNAELIVRWKLFVTPQNINTEYDVTEMTAEQFFTAFKKYQSQDIERQIAQLEQSQAKEQPLEDQQEDAESDEQKQEQADQVEA